VVAKKWILFVGGFTRGEVQVKSFGKKGIAVQEKRRRRMFRLKKTRLEEVLKRA